MTSYTTPVPEENVTRGTLLALLVIPLGVIVWTIIWNVGFIASIVSFGVAVLAVFLYRRGSGGTISRGGAIRVILIVIVTVALSLFVGVVSEVAIALGDVAGISPIDALTAPQFWPVFNQILAEPDVQKELLPAIGLGILFAALGCFSTLRRAFKGTAAQQAAATDTATAWTRPVDPTAVVPPVTPAETTDPTDPAAPRTPTV